jgi:Mlc titration factor MtfA (ptsG expression regulator)
MWPFVALACLIGCLVLFFRRRPVQPLSLEGRETLASQVGYFARLDAPEQARFIANVERFLADQHISGPRGKAVSDELRVLVAASAVALVFGRKGFVYPRTRDIVVYDEAFDAQYNIGTKERFIGMVHGSGPILFSARALREAFAKPRDGIHVGLHEFAHVIDFDGGVADGIPSLMPWGVADAWLVLVHKETQRIETRRSVLGSYAATNEAEFFAVATEAFFEKPRELREKHPQLYATLVAVYGQQPHMT